MSLRALVIRTSALGDIVHSLPALRALRRHDPGARIGWVVEKGLAPLLINDPDIDQVIEVSTRQWRQITQSAATCRDIGRTIKELQDFGADVVLDLMGNHKAGLLAAISLTDHRIGLQRRDRREPSSAVWLSQTVPALGKHAVEMSLSVVAGLGIDVEGVDFGASQLRSAAAGNPPPREPGSYLVIHPGAAWANKIYPPSRWGEVARALRDITGLEILISIGPGERQLSEALFEVAGSSASPAPAGSLAELVAVLDGAAMLLSGDTGPLHLAHALETPVLAVMGPTDPVTHGPWKAPHRTLIHRLDCSFCHRRYNTVQRCLLEIEPQQIVARATELLESPSDIS